MKRRIYTVYAVISLFLCAVVLRLFTWQVLSAETLQALAQKQTLSTASIQPKRGEIFFSDQTPMVLNQKAYLIYAEPDKLDLTPKTINILSEVNTIYGSHLIHSFLLPIPNFRQATIIKCQKFWLIRVSLPQPAPGRQMYCPRRI